MLQLFTKISQISYHQLMSLYEETVCKYASDHYSNFDRGEAIQYAQQDLYTYLASVFFKTRGAVLAVWMEGERYLCGLRIERHLDGFLITSLETVPDQRNRGYASKLLSSVLGRWRGTPIYSHILKNNIPSIRCHLRCGFRVAQDCAVFLDGTIRQDCVTLRYD